MVNNPHIFLDIDDTMITSAQYYGKKLHPKYLCHPFDSKCVNVLNKIIEKTNAIIILSSDWKHHFNIEQLNEIFKDNNINSIVTDITPSSWGKEFKSMKQLEECRAFEIQKYVDEHQITKWVAVDDLNLKPWIPNNFVWCTQLNEGIKQSGIEDKILKIII
jgi:hypothetical protein